MPLWNLLVLHSNRLSSFAETEKFPAQRALCMLLTNVDQTVFTAVC